MKNQEVTVIWFDQLKGIGEGKTKDGKTIFLNSINIASDGRFLTLHDNEVVSCDIESSGHNFYAKSIVRK